ncbi:hypothetical protein [Endozoicomonas arenosclerae]|uniref:hypothetical protein n=1 Tax=Endozoicomonas arenosclerae TaxID=1633495 RepID=UPI0007848C69|nr:hypothetical protein [Endozoicomonas arenosclerae]
MIWIVALIILVILGNFIWLLPPKSERRRMKLRNKAIMSGLTCREIKDRESLPDTIDIEQGPWLEYSIVSLTEEDDPVVVLEKSANEQWPEHTMVKPALFSKLPASAVRITFRNGCVAVLWNEDGELEDVQGIMDFLESVATTEAKPQQQS